MGAIVIDDTTVVSLGEVMAAVGVIVVSVVAVARWLRRHVRRYLEPVIREVTHNGGQSMKDDVVKVKDHVASIASVVDQLTDSSVTLKHSTAALERQVRRLFADRSADVHERAARREQLDATLRELTAQLADLRPVLEDYLESHPEARRRSQP